MEEKFEGAEITGNRPEDAILEELEGRLRSEVQAQGLEPMGGDNIGFRFSRNASRDIGSEKDLAEYLNEAAGFKTAKVVLHAEDRSGRHNHDVAEDVTMRLRLNARDFTDIYSIIDEDLPVESAGFNFIGYGETAFEAYKDASPRVYFLADHRGESLGATVSYREGDTVLENIWSEAEDQVRPLYEALQDSGVEYDGAVLVDEDEDDAWMIANYGSVDPTERI